MSKRKGLAFLAMAAGAVTAIVMGRRRRHHKQATEAQAPEEIVTQEDTPSSKPEDEGTPQIP